MPRPAVRLPLTLAPLLSASAADFRSPSRAKRAAVALPSSNTGSLPSLPVPNSFQSKKLLPDRAVSHSSSHSVLVKPSNRHIPEMGLSPLNSHLATNASTAAGSSSPGYNIGITRSQSMREHGATGLHRSPSAVAKELMMQQATGAAGLVLDRIQMLEVEEGAASDSDESDFELLQVRVFVAVAYNYN